MEQARGSSAGIAIAPRRSFETRLSTRHRVQPYTTNSDASRQHAVTGDWGSFNSGWSIDSSAQWEWLPPSYGRWDSGRWEAARHYQGSGRRQRSIGPSDHRLPCGLASSEAFDLMFREITPEDYETLLRLDETIARPTATAASIAKLPSIKGEEALGEDCPVCLNAFEPGEVLLMLPKCRHRFHSDCITKWLSEWKKKCPLCGEEVPSLPES
jgi:hypothetical protein